MLLAVPVWAFYSAFLKRRPAGVPDLALLTSSVIAGLILLLPIYLVRLGQGETISVSAVSVLGITYIAVFASVVAFLFWNRGVAAVGPNRAGAFIPPGGSGLGFRRHPVRKLAVSAYIGFT